MDEKLQSMLNQTYDAMKKAGKSDAEIESATRELYTKYTAGDFGGQVTQAQPEEVGFVQGMAQSIAKPFLKGVATVSSGFAAPAARMMGVSQEDVNRRLAEGIDFGYLGTAKPIGAAIYEDDARQKPISTTARAMADAAGTLAEGYSYTMAPLKTGFGFWNTVKEALPMAATFGASQGLQKAGEGGTMTEAGASALGNTVGAVAGYGLLKGGANFFAKWGSRALQTEAVRTAGAWTKDFAEKVWNALPEGFTKEAGNLKDLVGLSSKRTINALKKEFDMNWKTSSDAAVDSLIPEVNQPDLAFGKFQRNVASQMGEQFKVSNALYDDVKADQTVINAFDKAGAALEKAPTKTDISGKISPEQFAQIQKEAKEMSPAFTQFMEDMKPSIAQNLTLKQVLELNRQSLQYIPASNPNERQIIREFASGLFSDTRAQLEKENPELLDQWDLAYQSWKKASDLYESSVLNKLKSTGDVDTVVDKMINKPMTRDEQKLFLASIVGNEQATQDLFINSVLRKAKMANSKEDSAKIINQFLDNWDVGDGTSAFLTSEQAMMLDDLATMYNGNFDEFVAGMRELQGFSQETAKDLFDAQGKINVTKFVQEGRFDEIADGFYKLKDDPRFVTAINALSEEEKQALGIAITKDMFDANRTFVAKNADGTYDVKDFADSYVKMWEDIAGTEGKGGNEALYNIFSPEQIQQMEAAYASAKSTKELTSVPQTQMRSILHGALAVLYSAKGFFAGAGHHAGELISRPKAPSTAYYNEIDKLIESGLLEKNARMTIGDLLSMMLPASGQVTSKTAEEMVTE